MTMQFVREKIKNKIDWLLGKVKKVACRHLPKEVDRRFVAAMMHSLRDAISKAKDMPLSIGIPMVASLPGIFFEDVLAKKTHPMVRIALCCLSVICVIMTIGYKISRCMKRCIKWLLRPIAFRLFIFVVCLVGMCLMLWFADDSERTYRCAEAERCESWSRGWEHLRNINSLLDEFIEHSVSVVDARKYLQIIEGLDQCSTQAWDLMYNSEEYYKTEVFRYSLFAGCFVVMGLIAIISLLVLLLCKRVPVETSTGFKGSISALISWLLFSICIFIAVCELSGVKYSANSLERNEEEVNLYSPQVVEYLRDGYAKCKKFSKSKSIESAYVRPIKNIMEKLEEKKTGIEREIKEFPSFAHSIESCTYPYRATAYVAIACGLLFGWSFIGCLFGKGPWWPIKVAMGGLRFVRRHWIIFCIILGIVWITALFMYAVNKISDACRGRASVTRAELNNTNNTEQINSQQAATAEQMNQLYQLEQQRQQQQTQMMIMQNMQNMMNQTLDIAPTPSPMPMPKPRPNVEICPIHGCSYVRGIGMGGGCPKCNTAKYGL